MEMLVLTNEETAKTQAQEDDGRGGVFSTAQNAVKTEKMVIYYILKKVCKKYAEGMLKPSLLRQGLAKRA